MSILRSLASLLGGTFLAIILELSLESFRISLEYYLELSLVSYLELSLPIPTNNLIIWILILIPLDFLAIFFGFNLDQKIRHYYHVFMRKQALRIGILNDMKWGPDYMEKSTYTNTSPENWKNELEELGRDEKINVKLITCKDHFESYTVILNPYGEVYPEYDIAKLDTLNKIFEYAKDGGLFVNIAGIPCYYAFSPLLGRQVDLAFRYSPYAYMQMSNEKSDFFVPEFKYPLFDSTPLTKELDLTIRKLGNTQGFNWDLRPSVDFKDLYPVVKGTKVHRAAIVEKNVKPIVDPQVYLNGPGIRKGSSTPVFYLPYGNGGFLISLLFINQQPEDAQNQLKRAICKLILSHKQYA